MRLLPLLLGLLAANEITAREFPEDGTYKQQSDFINGLTYGCPADLHNAVQAISEADNPFQQVAEHTQNGNSVKVWHHAFDPENGVVFRRKIEADKNKPAAAVVDTEEVMIGGESQDGTLQPLTFRFKRGADGLLQVASKEKVPVTTFAEGVEQANKEGLVVKVNNCFTSVLKDKPAPKLVA
jgi:hypothetical protein